MEGRKIAQSELQEGDVILMAKSANLIVGRVERITKSGSIRYEFDSEQTLIDHYYDFKLENINYNKSAYIAKPWKEAYQRYFFLLERKY